MSANGDPARSAAEGEQAGPPGPGPRLRDSLAAIPAYRAGARPAPRDDLITFKVSSNENPYPPLPRVMDVIAAAATQVNRYPDPASADLTAAIAAYRQVPEAHVALGTGAVALCYQIAHCTAGPGDEIIFPWRSFEAYPIVAQVAGARLVPVPLTAGAVCDLDAMAAAVTARTRLIFVCSPNNPTGTVVSANALERFLAAVPPEIVVVVDEAYIEFNRDPLAADGIAAYRSRPNVVALRTFSKAYGLAGLRVGYALAHDEVATALRKTALPFGISVVAQAAALASLADDQELFERVEALVAERDRIAAALRAAGWDLADSQANFLWLPTGARTDEFTVACDAAGLTIRSFSGEGARVTVAEREANDRLIQVASGFVRT